MPFNYPRSGLNNVSEYQSSGLPYAFSGTSAGTPTEINFPFVTNFFEVKNNGSGTDIIAVGFTENGVQGVNRFLLAAGESRRLKLRVKTLYILGETGTPDFDVVAGLTTVPTKDMPILTGSAVQGVTGSFPAYVNELGYDGIG